MFEDVSANKFTANFNELLHVEFGDVVVPQMELGHSNLLHISNQHTWKHQHFLLRKYGSYIGTGKPYQRY